ncbi:STAS domain-containing protein [Actinotalea sp. Marseille-Q4924]|uniref:STAS domain-containing protein n=1 Tax=Actinotalea sp. Marseille-Q4924 TaxID=2866571 RepID=UPI001CE407A6|nr:STAS domain-containing protein [Actinotalea sp. Marseille-Q4924]
MDVTVTSRANGDRTVVEVTGEIDVYTAPALREELSSLIDAESTNLVVDLTQVSFMDSTGLGVLVGALKKVRTLGGDLQLVISQEKILKVFRITALTQVFTIHPTLEESLQG